MRNFKWFLLFVLLFCIPAYSQDANKPSELYNKLKSLPGVVDVNKTRNDAKFFKESYEVTFEQPLDHQNPNGEKFHQRVFV
jgi:hypothetical protein